MKKSSHLANKRRFGAKKPTRNSVRHRRHHPLGKLSDGAIVAIFLVFVVALIYVFDATEGDTEAEKDQEIILGNIIVSESLNDRVLTKISNTDYYEIKNQLGIQSEFVIHFEDADGNLVEVNGKPCVGSPYAKVNGHNCRK